MPAPIVPGGVVVVLGTRPEILKLAGLIDLLGPAARVVYTGQHYDDRLGPSFFRELGLPMIDVPLHVGGTPRGQQIGEALALLDRHFAERPPQAVVVQGDTNSAVAGALAANARELPLIHVEAGLRSYDRAMPEEHNRVLIDHLADRCCAPTETSRQNLEREGITGARVVVTGNTIVEALHGLAPTPKDRIRKLAARGLAQDGFVLATFHRPENVDDPDRLKEVLAQLGRVPLPVVLPLHPRTEARVREARLSPMLDRLHVVDPLPYGDFLALAGGCAFLISDSGGVQEEASVLKRPVVVVRHSTERPEVLGTFCRLVALGPGVGDLALEWAADLRPLHDSLRHLPSPYGDGTASARCLDATLDLLAHP